MKVVYVDDVHVKCSGENNDHPVTYYVLKDIGDRIPRYEAICGYCNIKFVLQNRNR